MFLELTRAPTKEKLYVIPNHIWYWYFSETTKATHVVSHSGAFFPVEESEQQVKEKLSFIRGR